MTSTTQVTKIGYPTGDLTHPALIDSYFIFKASITTANSDAVLSWDCVSITTEVTTDGDGNEITTIDADATATANNCFIVDERSTEVPGYFDGRSAGAADEGYNQYWLLM